MAFIYYHSFLAFHTLKRKKRLKTPLFFASIDLLSFFTNIFLLKITFFQKLHFVNYFFLENPYKPIKPLYHSLTLHWHNIMHINFYALRLILLLSLFLNALLILIYSFYTFTLGFLAIFFSSNIEFKESSLSYLFKNSYSFLNPSLLVSIQFLQPM